MRIFEFYSGSHWNSAKGWELSISREASGIGYAFLCIERIGLGLQRSLIKFMLNLHTEETDIRSLLPYMVKKEC
jgi:seryl-tRNA synthetase